MRQADCLAVSGWPCLPQCFIVTGRAEDNMKRILLLLGLSLFAAAAHAAVQGKDVSYEADGVKLKGYLAWDDAAKTPHPGVLVEIGRAHV